MERFICIHGHFYQPPRENPWLEDIEVQDSAYPYHDWNERVDAECYAPNSASRLIDGEGRITDIVSNYARISFNFGPTLLSWMQVHSPGVYAAILEADKQSIAWRSGHGNALAQPYNHPIVPLAGSRDKRTQILWGIKDFQLRYKRPPEGMWLPETAVDIETLDTMAEFGISFTILDPHQASNVRKIGEGKWEDVSGGQIDPSRAYLCMLPSGRRINLFFYDGPIAKAVAFEKLLEKGEDFVNRLVAGFSDDRQWPQIVNVATDGESYGHHHKFGDMALAYALHEIEARGLARLTNYGEYLGMNPPSHEVQIFDRTSWSCAHGVERWRGNCGCNTGGHQGWNQEWRAPLREAFDWLRDELSPLFEQGTREYLKNPWAARDDYIEVIFDRSKDKIDEFFTRHAARALNEAEKTYLLRVLEMQRHALLMYTSCGWFFDELSGTETVQIIQYAGRAIQLARELFGGDLEYPFKARLSKAKSNLSEHKDGGQVYERLVKLAVVDFERVAAHYAISSLIKDYGESANIYCYSVQRKDYAERRSGAAKLAIGQVLITSNITFRSEVVSFCSLYLGGHVFNGGVGVFPSDEKYQLMKTDMVGTFEKGAIADIIRLMDTHFGRNTYSLMHLFREEQRRILDIVIGETMEQFERSHRILYENNRTLMAFLPEAGIPVPEAFRAAAAFTLNLDLKRAFSEETIDTEKIKGIVSEIVGLNIALDSVNLEFMLRKKGESLMKRFSEAPSEFSLLSDFSVYLATAQSLPAEINYWYMQNIYYDMAKTVFKEFLSRANAGDAAAAKWVEVFRSTGEKLFFAPGVFSSSPGP